MAQRKKMANGGATAPDPLPKKGKKPSYPKAMTIRYDEQQEKEVMQMMEAMQVKTMSKAFLAAPKLLADAAEKVIRLEKEIEKQGLENYELRSMVESWNSFNKKLEEFVKKR